MSHFTDLLLVKPSNILPSTDNELSIRSAGLPGHRDPPQHFVLRALEHAQPPRLAHLLPVPSEAYNLVGALVKTTLALRIAAAYPAASPVDSSASPATLAANLLYPAASALSPATIRIIPGTIPLACDAPSSAVINAPSSAVINTLHATAPEAPDGARLSGTPAATSTATGEAVRAKTLGNQDPSPSLGLRLLIRGRGGR